MIQVYTLVEDGFESRTDLTAMNRYDVIRSVMDRIKGRVAVSVESIAAGKTRQEACLFSVVLRAEGPVGTSVMVWPNGDREYRNLALSGSRLITPDPPRVIRTG